MDVNMKYITKVEKTGNLRRILTGKKYFVKIYTISFFFQDLEKVFFDSLSEAEAFRIDFLVTCGANWRHDEPGR